MSSSVRNAKATPDSSLKNANFTRPDEYVNALHHTYLIDEGKLSVEEVEGQALWDEVAAVWTYFRRSEQFFDFVNIVLDNFTADKAIDALIEYQPIPAFEITRRHHFRAIAQYLDVPPAEQLRRIHPFCTALLEFAQADVDPRLRVDDKEVWVPPSEDEMVKRTLSILHFDQATLNRRWKYVRVQQVPETPPSPPVKIIQEARRPSMPKYLIYDEVECKLLTSIETMDIPREEIPLGDEISFPAFLELDGAMSMARLGDKIGYRARIGMAKDNGGVCSEDGQSCEISKTATGRNRVQCALLAELGHFTGSIREHAGGSHEELHLALIYLIKIKTPSVLKNYIAGQWGWSQVIVDDFLKAKLEAAGPSGSTAMAESREATESSGSTAITESQDVEDLTEKTQDNLSHLSARNEDETSQSPVQSEDSESPAPVVPAKRPHDVAVLLAESQGTSSIPYGSFEPEETQAITENIKGPHDNDIQEPASKRLKLSEDGSFLPSQAAVGESEQPLMHPYDFLIQKKARKYINKRLDRIFKAKNMAQTGTGTTSSASKSRKRSSGRSTLGSIVNRSYYPSDPQSVVPTSNGVLSASSSSVHPPTSNFTFVCKINGASPSSTR